MSTDPATTIKPYASVGGVAKSSDTLFGTPEGLLILRAKIDEALQSGRAEIEEEKITLKKVIRLDRPPGGQTTQKKSDQIFKIWFLSLWIVASMVFLVGVFQISRWLGIL